MKTTTFIFIFLFLIALGVPAMAGDDITLPGPATDSSVTFVTEKDVCVPRAEAIKAWGEALEHMPAAGGMGVPAMTLECDPCKCLTNMAECYEFMARREREKEERYKAATELYKRAKEHGICP